jgi:predicted metal-dependent phosphoesterase TrpH
LTAGDSTTQLAHELYGRQREDRETLLEEIKKAGGDLIVKVPVQGSLAMKADLNIPWNKLRIIRRWGE